MRWTSAVVTLAALVAGACGAGTGGSEAVTPTSEPDTCSRPGTTIAGPVGGPGALTEHQRAAASAAVAHDPVIAQVVGPWRTAVIGPLETDCPDGMRLLGADVWVTFDQPQEISWTNDGVACVDGEGQPVRVRYRWHGLRGAIASVFLPSRSVVWDTPEPPRDLRLPQPKADQTTVATLGPRGGPCPKPVDD